MRMGRLLVVEDDRRLGEALCGELRGAGWTVAWARDAHGGRRRADEGWDAILLDLGLPDGIFSERYLRHPPVGYLK